MKYFEKKENQPLIQRIEAIEDEVEFFFGNRPSIIYLYDQIDKNANSMRTLVRF